VERVKVGLIGLGTVGCGTVSILQEAAGVLADRTGASIEIARVAVRNPDRRRAVKLPEGVVTGDPGEVIRDPQIHIIVELVGGIEPARSYILEALENGKHVVTANKALLSQHWQELVEKAEERGVSLLFEGSVAGGVPLIRNIKQGLVANRIQSVTGIINGTCNYILTRMFMEKKAFTEVLREAQNKGFAEADPATDIDGIDAAQKLSILVNLCFNSSISYSDIPFQGITELTPLDLEMADEFGYRVKLLASAKRKDRQAEAWVHPTLVPHKHPLASVEGVLNAVYIEDDHLGSSLYSGQGAGGLPTGSAVVADIVSCVRDILSGAVGRVPVGCCRPGAGIEETLTLAGDTVSEFYVRVSAKDQPGVLSTISGVLGENGISISSVIQRGRGTAGGEAVPIVMIIHEASYSSMIRALRKIDSLDVVMGNSFLMRILPEGDNRWPAS
jgi:homoserine dehydrogenase